MKATEVLCTVCNHDIGYHIGMGGGICIEFIYNNKYRCPCEHFHDPGQPAETLVSKWDNVYFYSDPPLNDPVNHPSHYTSHPSGVECIQITEYMSFCLGNAIKYIWRHNEKNGLEDLKKAQWYLNREIARLENNDV